MLLQMTRSMRIRVGRIIALAYLFCVLAPAASLAWGSGASPCFDDDPVLLPAHHEMSASHIHGDVTHDRAGMHAQQQAQDAPGPHHHESKGHVGPCCAMMCASALPADLPDVAKPQQPVSACVPEIVVSLHSAAPPRHYRPPIT